MGYMSIVMVPPWIGAQALVGDRTQRVVRALGSASPGQECLEWRGCLLRSRSPRPSPVPQCKMEDSGTPTLSLVHMRGTLEPLQSQHWGPEGGAQAQGCPVKGSVNSQANWTPQINRHLHHRKQWVYEPLPSLY